jgi:hypothetical protein
LVNLIYNHQTYHILFHRWVNSYSDIYNNYFQTLSFQCVQYQGYGKGDWFFNKKTLRKYFCFTQLLVKPK